MTPDEANVLLTKAGMIDPRMRRTEALELADRAEAWSEILASVTLGDALDAMRDHYAGSKDALMPSDVLALAGVEVDPWRELTDVTAEVVEASKLRALAAAGVTLDELEVHEHDTAWLRAKFGHLDELERTPFDEAGEEE